MKFEQPISQGNKRETRLETPQVPYQREELLNVLSKRMRYVTSELQQVEELPPSREKAARLRQLSNWYDALASASKKYSQVTKEELADPAIEGQVWVSGDFQARLNEMANEEDEGREAVARAQRRADKETSGMASRARKVHARNAMPELTKEEIERVNRPLREKESRRLARLAEADEDVEVPAMTLSDKDLEPETEQDAYVRGLGERFAATEAADLAAEQTQVDFENDEDPFADLASQEKAEQPYAAEKTEEVATPESGVRKIPMEDRERQHQMAVIEALDESEESMVEAMQRYALGQLKLKKMKKNLENLRSTVTGGSSIDGEVIGVVEAAVQDLEQNIGDTLHYIRILGQQMASLRQELPEGVEHKKMAAKPAATRKRRAA